MALFTSRDNNVTVLYRMDSAIVPDTSSHSAAAAEHVDSKSVLTTIIKPLVISWAATCQ